MLEDLSALTREILRYETSSISVGSDRSFYYGGDAAVLARLRITVILALAQAPGANLQAPGRRVFLTGQATQGTDRWRDHNGMDD